MANEVVNRSIKDVLGDASCYIGNFAELTEDLSEVMVEDEQGKVILDFEGAVNVIQVTWDSVKETALECAGKEIEVRLPDGPLGIIIAAGLAALGFKL